MVFFFLLDYVHVSVWIRKVVLLISVPILVYEPTAQKTTQGNEVLSEVQWILDCFAPEAYP
jgi:hypothetical protein